MSKEINDLAGKRIGIVGVGRMGSNLARRLHERGAKICVVFDHDPKTMQAVAAEVDAIAAQSLAQVTKEADYILTVVTDDAAMRSLFSESGDSLLHEAKGRVFMNCATLTPATHTELNPRIYAAGASALETCMAGSITQARTGTLLFICGGDNAAFERVKPILEHCGAIRFIGKSGQAAQVKAMVNMLMNIHTAALAEALGMGDALGLDLSLLCDVFGHSGAKSRVLETDGEDMINQDYEVYFSCAHAAKDSGIALEIARAAGLYTPIAEVAKKRFDQVVALGFGEDDKSAISELSFKGRKGAGKAP